MYLKQFKGIQFSEFFFTAKKKKTFARKLQAHKLKLWANKPTEIWYTTITSVHIYISYVYNIEQKGISATKSRQYPEKISEWMLKLYKVSLSLSVSNIIYKNNKNIISKKREEKKVGIHINN